MSFVFLNSTLLPAAEARIPIDDRGFRFGDGVFETIAVRDQEDFDRPRLDADRRGLVIDG